MDWDGPPWGGRRVTYGRRMLFQRRQRWTSCPQRQEARQPRLELALAFSNPVPAMLGLPAEMGIEITSGSPCSFPVQLHGHEPRAVRQHDQQAPHLHDSRRSAQPGGPEQGQVPVPGRGNDRQHHQPLTPWLPSPQPTAGMVTKAFPAGCVTCSPLCCCRQGGRRRSTKPNTFHSLVAGRRAPICAMMGSNLVAGLSVLAVPAHVSGHPFALSPHFIIMNHFFVQTVCHSCM